MNVPDDSDIEPNELFDEQVRLYRKKLLCDVTNTPKKARDRGDTFASILKSQVLYNRHEDMMPSPCVNNADGDVGNPEATEKLGIKDCLKLDVETENEQT